MGFVPRLMLATLTVMATAAPAFAQAGSGVKVVEVREQLRGAIAPNPSWTSVTPGSEVMAGINSLFIHGHESHPFRSVPLSQSARSRLHESFRRRVSSYSRTTQLPQSRSIGP